MSDIVALLKKHKIKFQSNFKVKKDTLYFTRELFSLKFGLIRQNLHTALNGCWLSDCLTVSLVCEVL